ncbi:hypothetical protein [Methanococcoides methylutens]|uniref:hypothetical protein n=1 Tax=Methanococcoides methylutens TaxID=2226 RepID=UPI00064E8E19|nr:hypothetical protein [Methanococcoides methylutens]
MRSKYYSYTLIILSYGLLALVAESLIRLETAAMQTGINGFLENNLFLLIAPLMVLVGYAAIKTTKLTE